MSPAEAAAAVADPDPDRDPDEPAKSRTPVIAGRFTDARQAGGPAVLWRADRDAGGGLIDGPLRGAATVIFECRSPTWAGAANLAAMVEAALASHGAATVGEADEPAGPSALRGRYHARIVAVELPA